MNRGFASLWMNIAVSALMIVYHAVILLLHRHDSQSRDKVLNGIPPQYRIYPTSKVASLVFAYILACAWIIPIPLVAILGGLWGQNTFLENRNLFSGNAHSVRAELFFGVVELGIMWAIAIISTRMRVISECCINGPPQPLCVANISADLQ
jgi:ABC-type Fe3+ transport system permease subunit